jgi:hypothetical protein
MHWPVSLTPVQSFLQFSRWIKHAPINIQEVGVELVHQILYYFIE